MALEIRQCILTKNRCYKQGKKISPKGIIVHSTGANNPNLKRYIQPDDGIIGKNPYTNHWNTSIPSKCVHAFIGKDKNGIVRVYQTLPWDYRCWGCGSGKNGTYNDSYIQFEICEDSLADAKYFNEAFSLAIELCAYLSKKYNIPNSNIISHKEANKRGYASNHGDCDHWLVRFGRNMDWFRSQVVIKNNSSITTNGNTSNTSSISGGYIYQGIDYSLVFNPTYYTNKYPDLKAAFGTNATNLFNHFVNNGMNEARQASANFNVVTYKNRYSDLQNAFGDNLPSYYRHYIQNGHKEGRSAV